MTGAPGIADSAAKGVGIYPNRFDPSSITITKGDTITWTARENESEPHTVDADDGSFRNPGSTQCQSTHYEGCLIYGQGDQGIASTFSHTFNAVGSFGYSCKVHGFRGTVVVKAPAPPPATAAPRTQAPTQPQTQPQTQPEEDPGDPVPAEEAGVELSPSPSATTLAAEPAADDSNTGLIVGVLAAVALGGGIAIFAFTRGRASPS